MNASSPNPDPRSSNWRRLARLAAIAVVFVVGLLNWWHPVLRFSWQPLNQLVFLAVLALPIVGIVLAARLRPRWIGIPVAITLLLPAAGAALLALLTGMMLADTLVTGEDPSFTYVRGVPASHSVLRVYRTNGGASTAYGAVVRQERDLVPGVRLVREVHRAYPAEDVRIELVGAGRASFDGSPPASLRSVVWF